MNVIVSRLFLRVLLVVALLFPFYGANAQSEWVGWPSASETDGRFTVISGPLSAISYVAPEILIGIPATATQFDIELFDGDAGFGQTTRYDVNFFTSGFTYTLFSDPNRDGSGTDIELVRVDTDFADDSWDPYVTNHPVNPAAQGAGGFYWYRMNMVYNGDTDNEQFSNGLKLRIRSDASSASIIGALGAIVISASPFNILLDPPLNTPENTFDGDWVFNVQVPAGVAPPLNFFDSDADYVGDANAVGVPPDDNDLRPEFRISPSIRYELFAPNNELITLNTDPSGNFEEEVFSYNPQIAVPPGFYQWHWFGIDAANTLILRTDFLLLPVPDEIAVAVGNYVWVDENADGMQDAGEPGLAGVTVILRNAVGDIVGTRVTDSQGNYMFNNLPPSQYTVEIDTTTLPDGVAQTLNPVLDGADFGNQTLPYTVNLNPGDTNLTADFGFVWEDPNGNAGTAALGDRVWSDTNGNGIQDSSEAGLGGVEVSIYNDSDGNGIIEPGIDFPFAGAIDQNGNPGGTTSTESDGTYIFSGLPNDAYVVVVNPVTIPTGYIQTGDPDDFGTLASNPDDRLTTPIVMEPGDVYLNVDFGYQPDSLLSNSIGDTVFLDANSNGTQDSGEAGISEVTVALIDDQGGHVASATTDENGLYLFDGLPDGTYTVQVADANAILLGLEQSADPDSTLDNMSTVTVSGGIANLDQDFGYVPDGHLPGQGLLGDTVFFDQNGNGLPDSGEGIGFVTVELYDVTGSSLIDTTQTAFNGEYFFGDLVPDASYTVRVDTTTLPAGLSNSVDPDGGNDSESVINLAVDPDGINDGINLDQDFGYIVATATPGSIGDFIWLDVNANGVNDGLVGPDGFAGTDDDEPGIEGVTLDLYYDADADGGVDAGEPRIATTVTDGTGAYLFDQLPAGSYVVDVTDKANELYGYWHSLGAVDTNDNSQSDPYAVDLAEGENVITADFGYYFELASIGDFVWFDTDGNGFQDGGEPGLEGIEVTLTIDYQSGDQTILTTLTDGAGLYSFNNLLADEDYQGDGSSDEPVFTITVTAPDGLTASPIDQGNDDNIDSDNPDGELGDAFPGQNDDSNDFGFFDTGSISGNVSEDTDRDGTIEGPLPGVTVELFADADLNGQPDSGTPVDTQTTDVDGNYLFEDVQAGSYVVVETNPDGYESLSDGDATDPGDDTPPVNDPNDDIVPVTITVDSIALMAEDDDGNNFVDSPLLAGLGDTVWFDHNANGVKDTGENGIPNVTVNLVSGGSVIDTAMTDGTGFYEFAGILAGTYTVEVDSASFTTAVQQTHDFDDPVTTNPVSPNAATVTLAAGETNNDIDFGYRPLGTIGDTVWNDVDANGVQDGAELGIEGVDVTLTGPVNDNATTNASGFYEFTNLPAGVYSVTVSGVPLDGLQQTHDLDDPVTTSPATADTTSVELALSASEDSIVSRDDVDFGYRQLGAITGSVEEDTNGDGVGDQGLVTTVELFADTDGDGQPDGAAIDSMTTAADGSYTFTDVPPGDYVVVEVQPAGLVDVSDQDTAPDGDPFDGDTTVDNQVAVTVDPGETDAGNDFVDENQGSISGTVKEDTTGNGLGDTDLVGVTVELFADTDADGNPDGAAIDSMSTGADGSYLFNNVSPGDYVVVETQPAGLVDVSDQDEGPDGDPFDSDTTVDNQVASRVDPGEADTENNFVEVNQGGISGTVTEDTDGDGVGDTPIQGVIVELFEDTNGNGLFDTGEPSAGTTTTGADGSYSFTDLMPGAFVVVETQPANLVSVSDQDEDTAHAGDPDTQDSDTTVDDQIGVQLNAGETDAGNNFVEENQGSISGSVLEDTDGDDVGDTAQAGVTVELFEDTNGNGVVDAGETVVDTTTTGGDGSYQFDNVSPGNYVVVPVQNPDLVDILDQDQTPDGDAQDADTTVDNSVGVTLEPGEDDTGNNFVDENQGSISGSVTEDTTGDGVGDTAQAGVTVTLYEDTNGNGVVDAGEPSVDTTTTGADGSYSFDPVSPGDYVVIPDQAAGLTDLLDQDQAPDGDAHDGDTTVDNSVAVTVEPGEADASNNFIDINVGASISGTVTQDTTGNGVGDTGIQSVIVELFAADANGNPIGTALATMSTDVDGNYIFSGLLPGNYVVVETQPAGLISLLDQDETPDGDSFDTDSTIDDQVAVTLLPGEADTGNNFAEQELAAIEGQVLVDNDGNGTGDTGLSGVVITLLDSSSNPVGAPVTTGANGAYSFTDLTPGDYTVVESQPVGYVSVSDQDQNTTHAGDPDPQDSDTTVDEQIGVNLIPGETDLGNDFVERLDNICIPKPSDSNSNGNDYSIWINGEHFSAGANNTYMVDNATGTARYQGSVTSNSNGTTHNVDILFSGRTTDAPAGSPKLPSFPVDTSDWVYYTSISGNVGPYTLSRRGPAYQVGYGANMNNTGFGASGWMYFTNGSTTLNGDINIKLVDCSPRIDIRKQAKGPDSRTFESGATVEFEIVVTNTGEFDLTNVVVDDPITPSCNRTIGNLAIGGSFSYTCSVVLDSGSSVSKTWLDNFSPAYSYSGNDANTNFLGNWVENDPQGGGASSGRVLVGSNNKMWMNNYNYPGGSDFKPSAKRAVDMSGTDTATLSFDWVTHAGVDSTDAVALEVSTNGGSSFTQIDKFWGVNTGGKSESYDVSAYITSNTIFRFRVTDYYGGSDETFKLDNFKIVATGSDYPEGFINIANVSGEADGQTVTDSDPSEVVVENICVPKPSDAVGSVPFSIWIDHETFIADNGNSFTINAAAGTASYKGSVTSSTNGTNYNVDITFSGYTTTPPSGSPYLPNFTVDTSDWEYYTVVSGNIGPYTVSRRGPAFQIGYGANFWNHGYGGSGWFNATSGSTTLEADINILLSDCEKPTAAGNVVKLDFSSHGDASGGSLSDWNQIVSSGNLQIPSGSVIRHGDGAVVPGVSISTSNFISNNFTDNADAGNWVGTAADPYYILAADDIYYHGTTPATVTFGGLNPNSSYNVRIYALIGDNPNTLDTFSVSGDRTLSTSSYRGTRWSAAKLEQSDMVFSNMSVNASNQIVVTIPGGYYPLNAIVLEEYDNGGGSNNDSTLVINDNDSQIVKTGSWNTSSNRNAGDYQNDVSYTGNNGDYLEFTFTSKKISLIGPRDSSQGNVEIFLDDVSQGSINTYSSTYQAQQELFSRTGLSAGTHSIKMVKRSGSWMQLDALSY